MGLRRASIALAFLAMHITAACRFPVVEAPTTADAALDAGGPMPIYGGGDAASSDAPAVDATSGDAPAVDAVLVPPCVCGLHEVCVRDRCVPARFEPLSPTSSTCVTSARPWLRWGLPADVDGARVDLCEDRGCTRVRATWDVDGNALRVPDPLASGVYFWRLRARRGATIDADGTVWEFAVPGGAPFSDEHRSIGYLDLDGDGAEEFVGEAVETVSPGQTQRLLNIRFTGPGGAPQRLVLMQDTESRQLLWFEHGALGDVNGDGYGDLGVTLTIRIPYRSPEGTILSSSWSYYEERVYLGGPHPLDATPAARAPSTEGAVYGIESSIWPLRDIDGDGKGDAVALHHVEGPFGVPGAREVDLVGGESVTLTESSNPRCSGDQVAQRFYSGDFDADGRAEVVAVGCAPYEQRARVLGVRTGSVTAPDRPLGACPTLGRPAPSTTETVSVLDLDDDGYDDLVVGEPGRAVIPVVYRGGPGGLSEARCYAYPLADADASVPRDASDDVAPDVPPWQRPDHHSIAAGFQYACALDASGAAWCWGIGEWDALGTGTSTSTRPARVLGLGPASSIWASAMTSCAILRDESVWCWGAAPAVTVQRMSWPTPRRIPGLDGARSLFFYGSSAVCARIGDGSVRCYGDVSRFIGFPPYYPPLLAGTPVASLGSVRAIDGTRLVTLLLHDDLSAEYFAAGSSGVPEVRASVASAGAVTAVSAGNGWGALIMSDGSVSLVGYDVLAETDATRDRSLGPRPLPGATGVVAVAVGGTQAVGLRADGTVLRWGEVRDLRTRVWYRTATPMPGLRDIVEIAEGDRMGCARSRTGALFCWNLGDGYVGDGVWEARPDPVPISL